ncbi:MAG: ATP-binding cassette domain-containing protein [Nitrososphaeraceae archaeon]|jgi:ABC-2 type transport system ATP-binding protein
MSLHVRIVLRYHSQRLHILGYTNNRVGDTRDICREYEVSIGLEFILITVKNLFKQYDNVTVLNDINIEVFDNEVFGLLGPNGAGKTTLIHILATLIKPTAGTATVNGYDIIKNPSEVRSSIGIVFQAPSSDDMLTGYENLKLHSLLYAVPKELREKRISEVLELVSLTNRKDDQVKKYSGGMRRRLEIARGLLHKPTVIFLDEPTLGLDPSSREVMWKYINRLVKDEKITLILTTHYMEEADFLCDRIGIIDKGMIIALDSPTQLKERLGGEVIEMELTNKHVDKENIDRLLKQCDFVRKVELDAKKGNLLIYVDDASHNLPAILKILDNTNNTEIESVELRSPTLNDVFLKFAQRHITRKEGQDEDDSEGGFMERYAQYGNK